MAVFVILSVFALNTCTSEGVRLPKYIPTLQVNPGERNDIVESYFRLALDYTEILLYLVLLHGISLSLRQLRRVLKPKDSGGRRRNPSDLRELCPEPASKDPDRNSSKKSHQKSLQKDDKKVAKKVVKKVNKTLAKKVAKKCTKKVVKKSLKRRHKSLQKNLAIKKKLDIKLDKNVHMPAEKSKGNHGIYWTPYLTVTKFVSCSPVQCLCFSRRWRVALYLSLDNMIYLQSILQ